MKKDLVKIFRCPICKEELEISEVVELEKQSNGDKVVEGILICKGFPKHEFSIKNKILILMPLPNEIATE